MFAAKHQLKQSTSWSELL